MSVIIIIMYFSQDCSLSRLFPNEVILGKRFPLVIVAAATDHDDANDHVDANQDDDGSSS